MSEQMQPLADPVLLGQPLQVALVIAYADDGVVLVQATMPSERAGPAFNRPGVGPYNQLIGTRPTERSCTP